MPASRIFLYLCLSFVGGIFLNSFLPAGTLVQAGLAIFGIMFISIFWGRWRFVVIGFCVLFLVLGVWRHQQVWSNIPQTQEQNVSFIGLVAAEPDIRATHTKLTIKSDENSSRQITGKVLVTTGRYPEYQYGDKLKVTGKLAAPQEFEDFNYKNYLAKDGVYSVMYFPQVEYLGKIDRGLISVVYGKILSFKDKLRESVYGNLSPPQSSILGAMILGDKRRISDELKEKLNITGLRHITAISGMHVTILSIILMQFLMGIGFWRGQAFYATLLFLTLFIVMVGLPPSAVRAGLMAGSFLLAQKLGRSSSALRLVVLAVALMLALNPLLLGLDIGFQLSFLAVLGIIFLGPRFKRWLIKIPEQKFVNLRSILSMTLSAQIFTLPILIFNFGQVSLIAPLTNVLVLPLLPFILGLGFLAGITGMVSQTLGWVFSLPTWFLLTYIVKIIEWFSQIPLAFLTIENLHWIWLIVAYLILGGLVWRLNKTKI